MGLVAEWLGNGCYFPQESTESSYKRKTMYAGSNPAQSPKKLAQKVPIYTFWVCLLSANTKGTKVVPIFDGEQPSAF